MSSLPRFEGAWEINALDLRLQFLVRAVEGVVRDHQSDGSGYLDLTPSSETHIGELAITEFEGAIEEPKQTLTFDGALTALEDEFEGWMETIPSVPERYSEARELAFRGSWPFGSELPIIAL